MSRDSGRFPRLSVCVLVGSPARPLLSTAPITDTTSSLVATFVVQSIARAALVLHLLADLRALGLLTREAPRGLEFSRPLTNSLPGIAMMAPATRVCAVAASSATNLVTHSRLGYPGSPHVATARPATSSGSRKPDLSQTSSIWMGGLVSSSEPRWSPTTSAPVSSACASPSTRRIPVAPAG